MLFVEFKVDSDYIDKTFGGFNPVIVNRALQASAYDNAIESLLNGFVNAFM